MSDKQLFVKIEAYIEWQYPPKDAHEQAVRNAADIVVRRNAHRIQGLVTSLLAEFIALDHGAAQ